MFEKIATAAPDPVFGLAEAYRHDKNPDKINLTVGAYQTEDGQTPILACVKQAEGKILSGEKTKNYLPIDGESRYADLVSRLVLGESSPIIAQGRCAAAHTPGGTAALRIAGDLLRSNCGTKTIWMCDPTWANHPQIYAAAGLQIQRHPYLSPDRRALDFGAVKKSVAAANTGDAILLHTVCHNPTGFDFSREQWLEMLALIEQKQLIPIFDFAYQGLGESLETDAWPIREYVQRGREALICSSFSKNMGLYGERVGSIIAVVKEPTSRAGILSQIKSIVRTIYSTPPQHGGAIAHTILGDATLRSRWVEELEEMRLRIKELRQKFVERLTDLIPDHDFGFINQQIGMFSFSGLSRDQVIRLREEKSIYIIENGRINIAGINSSNIDRLGEAIAEVMESNKVEAKR